MRYLALLFLASVSYAQETFDFGPEEHSGGIQIPIRGSISTEIAYQVGDQPRWQNLGLASHFIFEDHFSWGRIFLDANFKLNAAYAIEGDPGYIKRNYGYERVLREFYWSKSFEEFTLSIGNKITIWGKADALVVTDMVSPRDQAQSLFAKASETRLGQNLLQFDYYKEQTQYQLILIPLPVMNRNPPNGHPYSFTTGYDLQNRESDREVEGGLRVRKTLDKLDLSFMGGWFHVRDPLIVLGSELEETYKGFWMLGAASSLASDPFLFKVEIAYRNQEPRQSGFSFERVNSIYTMVGVDYSLGEWGTLLLESGLFFSIQDAKDSSLNKKVPSLVLGWSDTFWDEVFEFSSFLYWINQFQNFLGRVGLKYHITDHWTASSLFTVITADQNDSYLGSFRTFDRFDFSIQYAFDLDP